MPRTIRMIVGLSLLAPAVFFTSAALAQAQSVAPGIHIIHPINQVLTPLFIMLGPIKVIGPFVKLTGTADDSLRRSIALRAFWISTIALPIEYLLRALIVLGLPIKL
jgi:multiple antibiotic resistance protein